MFTFISFFLCNCVQKRQVLKAGDKWPPNFTAVCAWLMLSAPACLALTVSATTSFGNHGTHIKKIEEENPGGHYASPPGRELKGFTMQIESDWCSHLPTCFLLNYWKLFLFLCIFKFSTLMYIFYVLYWMRSKLPKDCIPIAGSPVLRD